MRYITGTHRVTDMRLLHLHLHLRAEPCCSVFGTLTSRQSKFQTHAGTSAP